MELKQIKQLVKFCRESGVTYIKTDEIELSITPVLPGTSAIEQNPEVPTTMDEETLFWSAT